MATPKTQSVPVDGGLLHVGVWPGGDPVVVAIHGGMSSHVVWSTLVDRLAGAATVIAPDCRGAAGSENVGPPYGMTAHADDVRRVLDHFGAERAVIIGWSLGGFIAANAAAALGPRAAAVVLVDGGIPLPLRSGFDAESMKEELIEPAVKRYDAGELRGVNLESLSIDILDTLTGDTRDAARRVHAPMSFVWAEHGPQGEAVGYYALDTIYEFAAQHPLRIAEGHGLDHYALMLSDRGSQLVADEVRWALSTG
jgi:pimeloyl-ACP methyl ester carboxylesterase